MDEQKNSNFLSRNGIKPFKPGQTGNPKGFSAKGRFRRTFAQWVKDGDVKKVHEVLKDQAIAAKDFRFLQEFLDRVEGKVATKVDHTLRTQRLPGNLDLSEIPTEKLEAIAGLLQDARASAAAEDAEFEEVDEEEAPW